VGRLIVWTETGWLFGALLLSRCESGASRQGAGGVDVVHVIAGDD
jgi:hypothetical protein